MSMCPSGFSCVITWSSSGCTLLLPSVRFWNLNAKSWAWHRSQYMPIHSSRRMLSHKAQLSLLICLLSRLNTRKRLRVDRINSSEREQNNGLTPMPSPNRSHFSVRRSSRLSCKSNDLQQNRMLGPTAAQKSVRIWIFVIIGSFHS